MATKTYKSEPMAAVHEMIEGLRQGGAIDEQTMRDFDAACLSIAPEPERDAQDSGAIRPRSARH